MSDKDIPYAQKSATFYPDRDSKESRELDEYILVRRDKTPSQKEGPESGITEISTTHYPSTPQREEKKFSPFLTARLPSLVRSVKSKGPSGLGRTLSQKLDIPMYCRLHTQANPSEKEVLRSFAQGLFKGVHFRTRLGTSTSFGTDASGVLNKTGNVSGITGVSEWSAITSLFSEFFVHTYHYQVHVFNVGVVNPTSTAVLAIPTKLTATTYAITAGLVSVSLHNGEGTYASADSMTPNESRKFHNSASKSFAHLWRNDVAYDAGGPVNAVQDTQGWLQVLDASLLGGQVQFRVVSDGVLGPGTAGLNIGNATLVWDVSFRIRD